MSLPSKIQANRPRVTRPTDTSALYYFHHEQMRIHGITTAVFFVKSSFETLLITGRQQVHRSIHHVHSSIQYLTYDQPRIILAYRTVWICSGYVGRSQCKTTNDQD